MAGIAGRSSAAGETRERRRGGDLVAVFRTSRRSGVGLGVMSSSPLGVAPHAAFHGMAVGINSLNARHKRHQTAQARPRSPSRLSRGLSPWQLKRLEELLEEPLFICPPPACGQPRVRSRSRRRGHQQSALRSSRRLFHRLAADGPALVARRVKVATSSYRGGGISTIEGTWFYARNEPSQARFMSANRVRSRGSRH